MLLDRLPQLLLVLAASIASAAAIIGVLSRSFRSSEPTLAQRDEPAGTVFVFQAGILAEASVAAREFLAHARIDRPDLASVTAYLSRQFPNLGDRIAALRRARPISGTINADHTLSAAEGDAQLQIHCAHGLVRMTLLTSGQGERIPDQTAVIEEELQTLRSIAEDAPQLIWKQDAHDRVIWANAAYLRLADRLSPPNSQSDPLWPTKPILSDLKPVEPGSGPKVQRVPVMLPDQTDPQWFEVTSLIRGGGTIHFAVDANSAMQAENDRQKFIQTLTKTFAHLSIGLAIFDRDRRLVLFNPAFLDLTGLQVGFLSARPLVNSVLDRLRDMNMLPEPKNYTSWRDQVAALEAAAQRGTYYENWSLPSGRTYRVTGRPHPDGAIAFLFEDISDEILLTRHYRSELETAQAVLDNLDEGIAVFSRAGTLVLSNATYAEIWGTRAEGLQDITMRDEVTRWQSRSSASPVWDRLTKEAGTVAFDRSSWQDTIRLRDDRAMTCRFVRLVGGSTLVGFQPAPAKSATLVPALDAVETEFRRSVNRPRIVAGA